MFARLSLLLLVGWAVVGCQREANVPQLRLEAQQAMQQENVTQALTLYTRALALAPQSADLLVERGVAYLASGELAHAQEDFDVAIAKHPQHFSAWRERGRLRQQTGQTTEAIADYSQALNLQPRDAALLAQRGICYSLMKQLDEAIADFDAALALNDRLAPAYQARGLVHLQLQHAEQAAYDFHQADLLKAPLLDYAVAWSQALFAGSKPDEAERIASRALKDSPDHVELLILRGRIRLAQKSLTLAKTDFDRVLQLAPERHDVLLLRASVFNLQQHHAAARDDYSQYLIAHANHGLALAERARLQLLLQAWPAALDDCDAWLSAAKKSEGDDWARVMTYRAMAHYATGDWRSAQDDARAALNANPQRDDARSVWACAALADATLSPADQQIAFDHFSQLIATYPDDARLLNLRAIAYLMRGDPTLALADIDAALRRNETAPNLHATRALALVQLGRYADMLEICKRFSSEQRSQHFPAAQLSTLLSRLERSGTAVAAGDRLLAVGGDAPLALLAQGIRLAVSGRREPARAELQRGFDRLPGDDPLARHLRALLAIDREDYSAAREASIAALRHAPDDALLYVTHLLSALGEGDDATAQLDLEMAVALDPHALLSLAPLFGEWSRPAKDVQLASLPITLLVLPHRLPTGPAPAAETAEQRRSRVAQLLSQAGQAYYISRRPALAIERYDLALTLEQQSERFAARAAAHYALPNVAAAIADFTQAIDLRPNVAAYHFNRGQAYVSQQAFDEALADYTRAIELEPDRSAAYTHRAKIFALRKDDARAEADLARARQLKIEGK